MASFKKEYKKSRLNSLTDLSDFLSDQDEWTLLDSQMDLIHLEKVHRPSSDSFASYEIDQPLLRYGEDVLTLVERIKEDPTLQRQMQEDFFQALNLFEKKGILLAGTPMTYILMGQDVSQLGDEREKFRPSPSFRSKAWMSLPTFNTFIGGDTLIKLINRPLEEGDLLLNLGGGTHELIYRKAGHYFSTSAESRLAFSSDHLRQVAQRMDKGRVNKQGKIKAGSNLPWLQDFRLAKGALASALDIFLDVDPDRILLYGLVDSEQAEDDLIRTGCLPETYRGKIVCCKMDYARAIEKIAKGQLDLTMSMYYLELSQVPGYYSCLARHMQLPLD